MDREMADVETSSDDYGRRFAGAAGVWMLDVQRETTEMLLGAPGEAGTILEIGGGHAQATDTLVRLGTGLTVVGSHPASARRLRPRIAAGHCRFVVSDLLRLPFGDRSFDTVLSYRLLPHLERWQDFLAEASRIARRSIVVDYPVERGVNAATPLLFPLKKRLEGNTRTYRSFRDDELRAVLEPRGFRLAASRAEFALPMVVHRLLRRPRLSAQIEQRLRDLGMTERYGSPVIARFDRPARA